MGELFARLILLCIAVLPAYGALWLWPAGVFDAPIGQLTIAMLGKAVGAVLLGWAGLGLAAMALLPKDE